MSRLTINDLTVSNELDPTAMTKVSGGLNFESKDAMIGKPVHKGVAVIA